jgi:hypothetical protein
MCCGGFGGVVMAGWVRAGGLGVAGDLVPKDDTIIGLF